MSRMTRDHCYKGEEREDGSPLLFKDDKDQRPTLVERLRTEAKCEDVSR